MTNLNDESVYGSHVLYEKKHAQGILWTKPKIRGRGFGVTQGRGPKPDVFAISDA